MCKNHRARDSRATCGKGGAACSVSFRSIKREEVRSGYRWNAPGQLGKPASNYNVSRHYDAGKRDRFSCDFRRDRTYEPRRTRLLASIERRETRVGPSSCEQVIISLAISSVPFCDPWGVRITNVTKMAVKVTTNVERNWRYKRYWKNSINLNKMYIRAHQYRKSSLRLDTRSLPRPISPQLRR